MLFSYTHVNSPVRHGIHHKFEGAARWHSRGNAHYSRVLLSKFYYRMPENILILGRFRHQWYFLIDFARYLIESTRCVPKRLVFFCKSVALALHCFYVQQFRAWYVFKAFQRFSELYNVVPVNWPKIPETKRFKKIAAFGKHPFQSRFNF